MEKWIKFHAPREISNNIENIRKHATNMPIIISWGRLSNAASAFGRFWMKKTVSFHLLEIADWFIRPNVEIHVVPTGCVRWFIRRGNHSRAKFKRKVRAFNWITEKWLYERAVSVRHHEGRTEFGQQRVWRWHTAGFTSEVCIRYALYLAGVALAISFQLLNISLVLSRTKCRQLCAE